MNGVPIEKIILKPDSYGDSVPYQGVCLPEWRTPYPVMGSTKTVSPTRRMAGFTEGGLPEWRVLPGWRTLPGIPSDLCRQPQVGFPPRVDRVSISCGITGWVVIVLALWPHGCPQRLGRRTL